MTDPAFIGRCTICGGPCSGQSECDDCSDMVDCPKCDGTGWANGDYYSEDDCDKCHGLKEIPYRQL